MYYYQQNILAAAIHTKDANGPMETYLNGNRANYLEFSRTTYNAKVAIGALGGIEANVSYNMDYFDDVHRFYDPTQNAIWSAWNASGFYTQFAPLGATADVWTTTLSQYLFRALVAGNAVVSNGLTVGSEIVKDKDGNAIGGNGNLIVGTSADPRYKVHIFGIDTSGSLLAQSNFGAVIDGKRTVASAGLSDSCWQANGYNNPTKIGSICIASGGATDSGCIEFYTKATSLALALAMRINSVQALELVNYIESPEIADPSAPAANKGRLYIRDNGSGKTQLVARFPTGAIQVICTEP